MLLSLWVGLVLGLSPLGNSYTSRWGLIMDDKWIWASLLFTNNGDLKRRAIGIGRDVNLVYLFVGLRENAYRPYKCGSGFGRKDLFE